MEGVDYSPRTADAHIRRRSQKARPEIASSFAATLSVFPIASTSPLRVASPADRAINGITCRVLSSGRVLDEAFCTRHPPYFVRRSSLSTIRRRPHIRQGDG